jgi:very-short-patch-repair endonuclease
MPTKRLIHLARQLRKTSTDAERRIWHYVKSGRLSGYAFRRQHPMGNYIADYYCHSARLVIELDGDQHGEDRAMEYDRRRTDAMEQSGVEVIRFTNHEVMKDGESVALTILREDERRIEQRRERLGGGTPPPPP